MTNMTGLTDMLKVKDAKGFKRFFAPTQHPAMERMRNALGEAQNFAGLAPKLSPEDCKRGLARGVDLLVTTYERDIAEFERRVEEDRRQYAERLLHTAERELKEQREEQAA